MHGVSSWLARSCWSSSAQHACAAAAPIRGSRAAAVRGASAPAAALRLQCRSAMSGAASGESLQLSSTVAAAVSAQEGAPAAADTPADPIVQYVVLRRDLWTEHGWPLGSIVAQACHAATAALWSSRNDPVTGAYCAEDALDHMHKVVLEIKGETQLRNFAAKLAEAGVAYKLWVEQPEDFPTALATAPARKSAIAAHFKKLKLCKGV